MLTTAYVVRVSLGKSLGTTLIAVGCCYAGFCTVALAILGLDTRGALGCMGMVVPALAAVALAASCRR